MTETTTVDQTIEVLNRVHAADPSVLPALITHRVTCNDAVADDPTVQVSTSDKGYSFEVGLLGILNGLFGIREGNQGYIAAYYDDGQLTHFGRTAE